jgi:flagellar FliL protein
MSATAESVKSKSKAADTVEEPPKKSKKKLFLIIGLIVLLIGGYEAKSILLKPHYKPGQAVPAGKIFPLDQLTVNLSDGHLVQVSISLQLTSVAVPATISTDQPEIENDIIAIFGEQTYQGLLAPAQRQVVQNEILKQCQKITGTVDGAAEQVSAVYYTGFVIQ